MKNLTPLTVLLGAALIAVAIYFGLANMSSQSSPPITIPLQLEPSQVVEKDADISPRVLNTLNAHIEDIRTTLLAVDEAFKANHYQDIARHAEDMEALVQQIRQVAVDLPTSSFQLISRDLREIQHGMHELEEAAAEQKHDNAHHSYETVRRFLDSLEEDIERLQPRVR